MIYIKFQDLSEEKQEELLQVSREHVTHIYGESIQKYVDETGADYDSLIDEEMIKNLYTNHFVFNIYFPNDNFKTPLNFRGVFLCN
tara:strand:- start:51 stop:308 length:258 start_codon:yes stop_codon:yes gene_type:complete